MKRKPPQQEDEFDHPEEALHACVRDDNLPRLRELLTAAPAPELLNHQYPALGPPLHYAARLGRAAAVDLLLAAGADPHLVSTGEDPQLPALGFASWRGHRALARRLWTAGGPPERHVAGLQPYQISLVVAARYGHAAIVEDLLDAWEGGWSQELQDEALLWAARRWHYNVVALLLARGSFQQATLEKALGHAADNKFMLSYEWPVKYEGIDYTDQQLLIAALIDAGANPNAPSPEQGYNPPMWTAAANVNLTGALKMLLEKGADPNQALAVEGKSALHRVAKPVMAGPLAGEPARQNETAIRLLLRHGANVAQPDKEGETPLHTAAYGLDLRLFRLYLESRAAGPEQKALLQLKNQHGETLLHYAAAAGSIETMEYLLARDLDVNVVSEHGWTPLLCALTPTAFSGGWGTEVKSQANAVQAAQYLLARAADPRIVSKEGWTPLHALALHRDPENDTNTNTSAAATSATAAEQLAKDLLARGVDPEARAPLLSPYRGTVVAFTDMPWGHRLSAAMDHLDDLRMGLRGRLPPLHWAAERGAAGVIRALLAHGRVSVGAIDGDDDTMPARLAANSRFLLQRKDLADTIVDLLVGAGADR